MKRRNAAAAADSGKPPPRRPLKRGKISDGIYASIFLYLKFFLVWALVLLADFILDFRFEYLWPFWLMLRSVYDSFKFQGLAFSIFFVCITITSDVACYLFIPVQWLMFTASTYIWVQYVWQTERGICLPSVLLWLLFLYIEVGVRLRDLKSFPFHLDLCRPFAAHCVGYPVITLGFSFKSCISYRFRLRKQQDVQRENQFHLQLLQDALPLSAIAPPPPPANDKPKALPSQSSEEVVVANGGSPQNNSVLLTNRKPSTSSANSVSDSKDRESKRSSRSREVPEDFEFLEQPVSRNDACDNDTDLDDEGNDFEGASDLRADSNHIGIIKNTVKSNIQKQVASAPVIASSSSIKKNKAVNVAGVCAATREQQTCRLESDIKRLQSDLQLSRNTEQELRSQIINLSTNERLTKTELTQLRQDNENLQSKLHKVVTSRQQEKQNLASLEKKLQEEKKQRTALEQQLVTEKRRKAEELSASRANSTPTPSRSECVLDMCKSRRWELENELKKIGRDLRLKEDRIRLLEHETQALQQYRESQNDTEVLMSALGAMQDKNTHLESSLSAETRLKLDLFSALGEAKRQIEIQQSLLIQKEVELADLKSKVAEVMAFIPTSPSNFTTIGSSGLGMRYSPSASYGVGVTQMSGMEEDVLCKSSLNPAASDYTPKITQ